MTRKRRVYIISIPILLILLFYFWASAGNLNQDEYSGMRFFTEVKEAQNFDTIRLMTYNIGYLSGMTNNLAVDRDEELFISNRDKSIKLLSDLNVNICCLQEIDFDSDRSFNHNQLDELAFGVGYGFSSFVVNWDKKYVPFPYWPISQQFGTVLSGQAILSDFSIVENKRVELARADNPFYYDAFYLDRLAQVSKVKIEDNELVLINVHLEAWDSSAREIQAEQLIELYNSYKEEYAVIILGDFNATPPGAEKPYMIENTIQKIKDSALLEMAIQDTSYFSDESAFFTFNSSDPYIRIDYMFYDKRKLRLFNSRVVKEAGEISDHLPLITDFIFID